MYYTDFRLFLFANHVYIGTEHDTVYKHSHVLPS